jgi:hypothetical protein
MTNTSQVDIENKHRIQIMFKVHDTFLDNVIENLEDRFADTGTLQHFGIVFDPARLEVDGDVYLDEDQVASLEVMYM